MTLIASPRRLLSTASAARTVDVTKVYGSGDTAVRALGPTTGGVA
ncbi:MAG: hypothetical protein ACRD2C_24270 [Acidimicrobiales bacterium]